MFRDIFQEGVRAWNTTLSSVGGGSVILGESDPGMEMYPPLSRPLSEVNSSRTNNTAAGCHCNMTSSEGCYKDACCTIDWKRTDINLDLRSGTLAVAHSNLYTLPYHIIDRYWKWVTILDLSYNRIECVLIKYYFLHS